MGRVSRGLSAECLLMDDQVRATFELVAHEFIPSRAYKIDVSIESIKNISVVDQRLTWSRLVDGKSSTGLDVYFEADVLSGNDETQNELELSLQMLLDSKANAFRKSFDSALNERPGEEDQPESSEADYSLEPIKLPVGLAAIAMGCVSFIVILTVSARHLKKEIQEEKHLSETSIDIAEVNDVVPRGLQTSYPVQEASGQPVQRPTGAVRVSVSFLCQGIVCHPGRSSQHIIPILRLLSLLGFKRVR